MIVTVRITERPDTDALHAALDALGRNQVQWPRTLPGDLVCEFAESVDLATVHALVLATAPTPAEGSEAKRRRLLIDGLSKADLVRAIIDPAARDALRDQLA